MHVSAIKTDMLMLAQLLLGINVRGIGDLCEVDSLCGPLSESKCWVRPKSPVTMSFITSSFALMHAMSGKQNTNSRKPKRSKHEIKYVYTSDFLWFKLFPFGLVCV